MTGKGIKLTLLFLAGLGVLQLIPAAEYTWDGRNAEWSDQAGWGGRPWEESDAIGHVTNNGPMAGGAVFQGQLHIHTNGTLKIANAPAATNAILRMKGGSLIGHIGGRSLMSAIHADAYSLLGGGADFALYGSIQGSADLEKVEGNVVNLYGDASAYAGRWLISGGTFYVRTDNALGTAPVIMASNTVVNLRSDRNWTLRNDMAGSGSLTVWGASGRTLTLEGSTLRPGGDEIPGTLAIRNEAINNALNVTFGMDGDKACRLKIDIVGGGGEAGVDHDRLVVTKGNVAGLEQVDLFLEFSRSLKSVAMEGAVLTILTCSNDLTTRSFRSVSLTEDWRAIVNYGNGVVTLSGIHKIVRGTVVTVR